ncbi:glycosyltransferase family 2 protein [Parapedobacter koreensis]|uniref:Glycosyltransferase involved in cell wall bisynthesis n=1 Tax=Parapedobacter koreensis TaxID=332977 RepID=A0A1H7IH41_9SPHI|nr:glycosyltransferase family A protein [Parapedobacter koreensis]SEK61644.1 Glycosyltransferase involved in cell wall bisynthesis [Parapedobacter koreensis]
MSNYYTNTCCMGNVLLSIIIPCYNHGQYLMEAINCFPDYWHQEKYEIVIINDGSTETHTLETLQELARQGYRVIHQQNQGLCSARNNGINASAGKYILPLDSDDKVSIQYIYEAIEILENQPEYTVVYCDGEYFNAKTGPWIIGEFNLQRLMLWNYMHVSAVFRREAWQKVGGYDMNLNRLGFEDWDLWLSIAFTGGKFYYLKKSLFAYRISPNSMVRSFTGSKYKQMQDYIHQKHRTYLSRDHLNNHLVLFMKRSKRLWIKLFLRIYFPGYLSKLVKKGKVDDVNIF